MDVINMGRNESGKRWRVKNPEKAREMNRRSNAKYKSKNIERIKECDKVGACEIIRKHHEDMIGDPERLTTEFIKRIINLKCD